MSHYFDFTKAKKFITEYGILLCKEHKITTWHFKFKEEVNEYTYQTNLLRSTPTLQSWEFPQDSSSHSTFMKKCCVNSAKPNKGQYKVLSLCYI